MPETRATALVGVHYSQFYVLDPRFGLNTITDLASPDDRLIVSGNDGVYVTTGLHTGPIRVTVSLHSGDPGVEHGVWEKVIEVPFSSTTGTAVISSWDGDSEELPNLAFNGPGDYRIRLHVRGRELGWETDTMDDDDDPVEEYLLQVWPSPAT